MVVSTSGRYSFIYSSNAMLMMLMLAIAMHLKSARPHHMCNVSLESVHALLATCLPRCERSPHAFSESNSFPSSCNLPIAALIDSKVNIVVMAAGTALSMFVPMPL